jgi:hypothetical protein
MTVREAAQSLHPALRFCHSRGQAAAGFSAGPGVPRDAGAFEGMTRSPATMLLGTNRQFESLIRSLDTQIGKLERAVLDNTAGRSAMLLDELWARRRSLQLLMLNRRVEAAKPVVNFQKWRDGNGAIYLCSAPLDGKRKATR